MNTKIIKFDINKNLYNTLIAKQGDTKSRFLLFNLLDGSIPFSLENRSVRVYAVKPDRTEVFNDLIITDAAKGYCILELTTQMLAVAGTVKLELMVIEEDKKLTSSIFYMDVKESINSEKAVVSTNEFGALLTALSSLNEYDNYKKEIAAARDGEANLLTKVKKIDEQLDNKTNIKTTENIINQNYSKLFDKIKSVNMYVPYNTDEFGDYQTLINKAVEVGCNYISFCPRLAMAEKTSTTITRTTDDTLLQTYINYAISKGLKVILKPHIFITNGNLGGSSNIQPSDTSLWIKSLQDNLVYYYTLLGNKISIISISNECTNQNDKNYSDWVNLINTLKSLNSNILTTVATTDIGMITNVVYPIVDIIGCNLYVGLRGNKNTSSYELKKSVYNDYTYSKDFISTLLNYSKQYNKPILITEVGCLPFTESLNTPARWEYDNGTPIDEDIQVVYYKTILPTYLESQAFLGCSIWSIGDGFTFVGRKAEQTLKEIYGGVENV